MEQGDQQPSGELAALAQGEQRPAQLVAEAPRMDAGAFASWSAFLAYFAVYQRETFQIYMCKSSTSASTRNHRVLSDRQSSASEDGTPRRPERVLPLVPDAVGVYAKTFICTHGNKPRPRGKGLRPHRQYRSTLCPAKVNLVAKKLPGRDARDPTAWNVVVTRHNLIHNHPLDAETYKKYPQGRRVEDPHVLETVDALHRAGVKQRQIREYLAERTPHKNVTRSDVHNLLIRMKQKRPRQAENENSSSDERPNPPNFTSVVTQATTLVDLPTASLDPIPQIPNSPAQLFVPRHEPTATANPARQQFPPYFTHSTSSNTAGSEEATQPTPANTTDRASLQHALTPQTAVVEDQSGSFRLRVGRSEQQHVVPYQQHELSREQEVSQGAGVAAPSSLANHEYAASLPHSLSAMAAEVGERSGSFRLRVNRLERQNIDLYQLNARLKAESMSQRAELDEAKALIRHLRSQVAALQAQLGGSVYDRDQVREGTASVSSDDQRASISEDLR